MMSNFRSPLILFVAASVFYVAGILFKIQHWPGATLILGSMMMVQFLAIVWVVVGMFRGAGKKNEQ